MTKKEKNEDWWHEDNSTTADLLRGPMRGWDGMEGQCSLIVDGTYCHPFFVYLRGHSGVHKVCFKGEHESWKEWMSVKSQKKMTLAVHQGQSWWQGGRVNLCWRGVGAICNWRQGRQDAHWQWANECGTVCQSGAALRRVDLSMLTSVPRAQHNPLVLKIHSFLPLQRQSCSSTLRCLTWATNLRFCVTVSLKTWLFFFLSSLKLKTKKTPKRIFTWCKKFCSFESYLEFYPTCLSVSVCIVWMNSQWTLQALYSAKSANNAPLSSYYHTAYGKCHQNNS